VDLTVGQTMTGMSRLAELRVLRDGGNGLEFVNELIRAHAYMSVPSTMRRVLHAHIADRLIEADSRGDSVPGLEVAWHCIRCGRPEAATPYLLRGARQAMQRGAPHEAERGLITGLDSLGARRAEGVILLAEALQEQGQWSASLSVLEDSSVTCNATAQAVGKALRVIAQDSLCQLVTGDMREQLAVLTTTIRDHAEAEVIAATARAAAALAMSLREPSLAVSVLAALDRSRAVEFHGFHAEWVALANAQLLYLSQRRVVARDRLLAIVTDLESNGVASAVVGQLQIGLGSIRCGLGDYVGAVAPFEKAYRVAERLENETRRTAAAANLALCYGRLGEYQKQLDWAKLAASQWKHAPRTYTDVLRDYSSALAYAMTNQRDESLSALSRLLAPLAIGIPDWAIQAQHFYAADVNLLLGRNKDAREAASRALGLPPRLLSPAFAGPYARWRALLGSENGATADAEAEIGRMRDGLDEYDAIDQVQILAGWAQIKSQRISRRLPYSHHRNLSERLAILPPAVSQQLDRLSKSAQ
jgi:tetratricopeptide (TPR) repeat protein